MNTNDTLNISRKVINAVTTQTRILRRHKTVNRIILVTLFLVGGCLAASGYIGFVGVGIGVVILLLSQAISWFASLKDPDETDLRWYRVELFLLILITAELGYFAIAGDKIWVIP